MQLQKTALRTARTLYKGWRHAKRRLRPGRPSGDSARLDTVARNLRYFANRGPAFEDPLDVAPPATPAASDNPARAIAFYLPQFHRFPENDAWWGRGFTEWRNVARGTPRYRGHYQPRIPADLGCYDLSDPSVIEAQAALALQNGLSAFCFYYYWFNGKRLMEKPLDLFTGLDTELGFCLMWANENWTRTWDGLDDEVLIAQDYRDQDEDDFIADTARYMAHPRYLRVQGRPLFILYRPGLLPDSRDTIARWRTKWQAALGVTPWVLMAQGFGETDPRPHGLDGAVEFPPHKICQGLPDASTEVKVLDRDFTGLVRDYDAVVDNALAQPVAEFPEIRTVSPSWDNDARREARGSSWKGSSPQAYERWLQGTLAHAEAHPFHGEPLVFINAWNEWAEGAYLEPDVHYGHAYLNATRRVMQRLGGSNAGSPLLLLGHDAHRHGAQMLLLNLARTFTRELGLDVHIVLKEGGDLVAEYRRYGRTTVLNGTPIERYLAGAKEYRYSAAITNTTVTGDLVPGLRKAGLRVVSLIHELPTLIREYGLEGEVRNIARHAQHVVFPAELVQQGFEPVAGSFGGRVHIRPQGTYLRIEHNDSDRQRFREELGLSATDRLVINVGYADLRKGFDLFVQTALQALRQDPDLHVAWIGTLSRDMRDWVGADAMAPDVAARFHLPGFRDQSTAHYSAADAFLLTSREDPYPTVVLEAMEAGLPVIVYRGTTGFDTLMDTHGWLVERGDIPATLDALDSIWQTDNELARAARVRHVRQNCQLRDYCVDLLAWAGVSVPESRAHDAPARTLERRAA